MTTADKGMDLTQMAQRVLWMDEERRRDRAELTRLAQETANTLAVLKDQAVKLREMGDRLASLESSLARVARLEDAVTLARSELAQMQEMDRHRQEEARRQERDRRAQAEESARIWGEVMGRIESLVKAADSVAARVDVLETRERDHVERFSELQSHITHLDTAQARAAEERKRVLARMESLVAEVQQMRQEMVAARDEDARQRKEDAASLAQHKEALAPLQRQVDDLTEGRKAAEARLDRLEENAYLGGQSLARLQAVEEQVAVVQAAYSGFQAAEDERWGKEIPEIRQLVEEFSGTSKSNAALLQELVASSQALKEDVRQLEASILKGRTYSEELADSLKRLLEEDARTRLVEAQKFMQGLRKLSKIQEERGTAET